MKECKYCGTVYADNLSACPSCGGTRIITDEERIEETDFKRKETENRERAIAAPQKQRNLIIGVLASVIVAVVGIIIAVSINANKPLSNGMTKDEGDEMLAKGISYLDSGDYELAMECFSRLPSDSDQYEEAQSLFSQASFAYRNGIVDKVNSYLSANEYDSALNLVNKAQSVIEDDAELQDLYDSVYSDYLNSVVDQVKAYTSEGQYEMAIEYLNNVQGKFPNDSTLQSVHTETWATYKGIVRDDAMQLADSYVANGDYEEAISSLKTAIEKINSDEELSAKVAVYSKAYKDNVLQQIDSIYSAGGYDAVISMLKTAISILPNDSELEQEYELWSSRTTVQLTDMECYSKSRSVIINTSNPGWAKDNYGTSYTSNIIAGEDGTSYVEYYLNGNYARLNGTIFVQNGARDINPSYFTWDIATVSVYGDDDLLYTHTGFSTKDAPIDLSIDITGVEFLKISFKDDYFVDTGMHDPLIGLGNITVGW